MNQNENGLPGSPLSFCSIIILFVNCLLINLFLNPNLWDSAAKLNEKKAISARTLLKDVYII